jgi:hypothetical protein
VICVQDDVPVPVYIYRHLRVVQQEAKSLENIAAFWRSRGLVLPSIMTASMCLDIPELFRQVAIRGGFWACSAGQVRSPLSLEVSDVLPAFCVDRLCVQGCCCVGPPSAYTWHCRCSLSLSAVVGELLSGGQCTPLAAHFGKLTFCKLTPTLTGLLRVFCCR